MSDDRSQTTETSVARMICETLFGLFDPHETGSSSVSQQSLLAARAVVSDLIERCARIAEADHAIAVGQRIAANIRRLHDT